MSKLTNSQWKAVNTRDTNVLVAASAGTGKTHAMITRVKELIMGRVSVRDNNIEITNEDKTKRVPIDRILLMTYTKAAAAEMKTRLNEALIDELNNLSGQEQDITDKRAYITEQIDNIPIADISTIHSFCASVIRKYFQEIGVNPLFETADSEDETAFISEAMLETFDILKDDNSLKELRQIFQTKMKDDNLKEIIVKIYNYAYSQEDMDLWLNLVCLSQYQDDFTNSLTSKYFIESIREEANDLFNELISIKSIADSFGQIKYSEWLSVAIEAIGKFSVVKNLDEIIELVKLPEIDTNSAPRINKCPDLSNLKKEFKDNIKDFYQNNNLSPEFINSETIKTQVKEVGEMTAKVVFLVTEFARIYSEIKLRENKLTFQDLEQFTVKLLSKNDIANDIGSKYDYILIDEYQDINYLQENIINRISSGNNLFMVGDSKQSIYRFRQAVPEIFISKEKLYNDELKGFATTFNNNFRSRKAILDYVNLIFSNIMTESFGGVDYRNKAMLVTEPDDDSIYSKVNDYPAVSILTYKQPQREKKEVDSSIYSVKEHQDEDEELTSSVMEANIINNAIKQLIGTPFYDKKNDTVRNLCYRDFSIILRSRTNASNMIINKLQEMNIPMNTSSFDKSDKTDEIRLIINVLSVLDNIRQDIPLTAIMRSYFGKFTDDELASIRLSAKNYNDYLYEILPAVTDKKLRVKIDKLMEFINKFRYKASYLSIFNLVNEIINETGFDRYILSHPDGVEMNKAIWAFLYSIKDKSYANNISRFLYHYDNYVTTIVRPKSSENGIDAVSVSTMHAVKGLEYPVVILANADSTFNTRKDKYVMDNEMGLCFLYYNLLDREIGKNIIYTVMSNRKDKKSKEDNLNLFYVALTRAKNHLIITGKENKDGLYCPKKPSNATNFLNFAAVGADKADCRCYQPEDLPEIDLFDKDRDKDKRVMAVFSPKVDSTYSEIIKNTLKDEYRYKESSQIGIKYSVSAINKSDEIDDIYIPSLLDDNIKELGTINHKVMEHIDFKCNSVQDVLTDIMRMLDEQLITSEEAESVNHKEILNCLMSPSLQLARRSNVRREQSFMLKVKANEILDTSSNDEVLLQGTIDLIIEGEQNIIVDYKKTSINDTEIIKKIYRKQIDLYALAVERILGIKVHKKIIYLFNQFKEINMD